MASKDQLSDSGEPKDSSHTLKRPGLFAVKAILENTRKSWPRFSILVASTEGVSNRRDYRAYLKLLTDLGWIRIRKISLATSKHYSKKVPLYEVTEKGLEFLDLFPKDGEKPKAYSTGEA